MSQRFRTLVRTGITVVASLTLLVAIWGTQPSQFQDRAGVREREGEGEELSLRALARSSSRQLPIMVVREKIGESGEAERFGGPAAEAYENRALPRANIKFKQVKRAIVASGSIPSGRIGLSGPLAAGWQELGPVTPTVPAIATYTDRATQNSGRVTSLAIASTCVPGDCEIWVGAAGGGVWYAPNALAAEPAWQPLDAGITSNAIGSLAIDPNDPSRVFVGTGEPNGSGDSEAGVGLFTSTGGGPWTLVPASVPIARDRSIGSIAIDPTDSDHYYLGTAVARHGSSSANGGRRTPPNAPTLGVYETTDGGATFDLVFSLDPNPTPASTGNDWFQGGVNRILLDPNDPETVYVALFGYGLWRRSPSIDGTTQFRQVFQTFNPDDTFGDRTEFDLVDVGNTTRIYLGDSSDDLAYSVVWRTDDANVPAADLLTGGTNGGWTLLSSPVNGTDGFGSYFFCHFQCGYDMFVESPPGQPDTVWIGGAMNYDELPVFGGNGRSNGRAVMRSTDAGVSFTDMTNDAQNPPLGMHPDQHAIVFASDPDIAIVGSDGGVIRTDGTYVDDSGECASRPIEGPDLVDCENWLSAVPSLLTTMNDGLATIQFQSLSVNPDDPLGDLMGGTQDNGTWLFSGGPEWLETIDGDGGQSGYGAEDSDIRVHTYFDATPDVSFDAGVPGSWNWIGDPLQKSKEQRSFYVPLITDPVVGGAMFTGMESIWRTQNNGGPQAFLEENCNEYTGTFQHVCGDWKPIGAGTKGNLTSTFYGRDKLGHYVVATERSGGDTGTLWAGTRVGRVFVSKNANAPRQQVSYRRIDTPVQPERFVSGIAIDPTNSNHAFVSFSGYEAYTPGQPGHVFEVTFHAGTGTATWTDISANIGDQPVTDVAFDDRTGDVYVSTDFSVLRLEDGGSVWVEAATGLPPVATYGLTIDTSGRVLYAATHGRGAWSLALP
jgi:hypothetical protein